MSQADGTAYNVNAYFHPVSHYESPDDVLGDTRLSTDEKRVILSSWASDMYVVESHPAFRKIPGIPHELRLDDILAALRQLDDDTDPRPRGGLGMRLPGPGRLSCTASGDPQYSGGVPARQYRPTRVLRALKHSRWTREDNVRRYRRLLNTQLTDVERNFIERRLAEELHG